ncbi:hypothetical protein AcdelDRAFT_1444, partial [Acidovorax delafieldii 2AN]
MPSVSLRTAPVSLNRRTALLGAVGLLALPATGAAAT